MSAFRSILAEVDPRADRQLAVDRVEQLTADDDTAITLLLCDSPGSPSDDPAAAGLEQAREEYRAGLERWLDSQAARLAGRRVTTALVHHSPRYEAILEHADDADADLIMRPARWHSKLERLLVGATDWELVRRAPQTVWLVKTAPAEGRQGLNVLAAVDPAHAEERKVGLDQRVLATGAAIATATGGTLRLFHAWQPGLAIAPAVAASPHVPMPVVRVDAETVERLRRQRESMLESLAADFDIPDSHRHLVEAAVTDAADDLVTRYSIDVVVTGGISRGRLERLIIGNTAEAILEHVDCDVVVVKPVASARG